MRLLISVLASALLLLPAAAGAQETNAPPGNAGIDEYLESVPAADGNKRVSPNRGGNDGISAETRGDLEAAGIDGKLAADLASGGTPAGGRSPGKGDAERDGSAPGGVSTLPDERTESPVRAVVEAVTGGAASDSGMGPMLPILLVLALCGMVAAAVARRRTTG